MTTVLAIAYGLYLTLVGVHGNAPALFGEIGQERQFLYWIIVLLVVSALWETESGAEIAKPLAILIVIGFLLRNYSTLQKNAASLNSTGG